MIGQRMKLSSSGYVTADHIDSLDGFRGLAALFVVIMHFLSLTKIGHGTIGMGGGQIGVMLFFVLSGFLMAHLYINNGADIDNRKRLCMSYGYDKAT